MRQQFTRVAPQKIRNLDLPEIQQLETILREGESVQAVAVGEFNNRGIFLAIVTDTRILFIQKHFWGHDIEEYALDSIDREIRCELQPHTGTIHLKFRKGKVKLCELEVQEAVLFTTTIVRLAKIAPQKKSVHDYLAKLPATPLDKHMNGFVYLLSEPHGNYKIGLTIDVEKRMAALRTQPPFKIQVAHKFPCDDPHTAEKRLHARFAKKRINGEWFHLDQGDVRFIQQIVRFERGKFVASSWLGEKDVSV